VGKKNGTSEFYDWLDAFGGAALIVIFFIVVSGAVYVFTEV